MALNFGGGLFELEDKGLLGQEKRPSTFQCFELTLTFAVGKTFGGSLENNQVPTIPVPQDFILEFIEVIMTMTNFAGDSGTATFKSARTATPSTYFFDKSVASPTGASCIASKNIGLEDFTPGENVKVRLEFADGLYGTQAGSSFLGSWTSRFICHGRYV